MSLMAVSTILARSLSAAERLNNLWLWKEQHTHRRSAGGCDVRRRSPGVTFLDGGKQDANRFQLVIVHAVRYACSGHTRRDRLHDGDFGGESVECEAPHG